MSSNSSNTSSPMYELIGGVEYIHQYAMIYLPYMVITSFIAVFGTIGNILLIFAIILSKDLRQTGNLLLINLAVSDVLVASIANGQSLIGLLVGESFFQRPKGICITIAAVAQLLSNNVLFTLPTIAVNRYVKICRPHLYEKIFSQQRTIVYCVAIWLLSVSSVSIQFIPGLLPYTFDRKTMACMSDRAAPLYLKMCIISMFVFGPGSASAFCYSRIFLFVRDSKRRVHASGGSTSNSKVDTNLSLTLFLVWIVYLVMMLPLCILFVVDSFDMLPKWPYPYALALAYFNTVVNPILYGVANKSFRKGFRVVLCIDQCFKLNAATTMVVNSSRTTVPAGSTTTPRQTTSDVI